MLADPAFALLGEGCCADGSQARIEVSESGPFAGHGNLSKRIPSRAPGRAKSPMRRIPKGSFASHRNPKRHLKRMPRPLPFSVQDCAWALRPHHRGRGTRSPPFGCGMVRKICPRHVFGIPQTLAIAQGKTSCSKWQTMSVFLACLVQA